MQYRQYQDKLDAIYENALATILELMQECNVKEHTFDASGVFANSISVNSEITRIALIPLDTDSIETDLIKVEIKGEFYGLAEIANVMEIVQLYDALYSDLIVE